MPSPVPKRSGASTSAMIRSAHFPAEAERAAPAPRGSDPHGAGLTAKRGALLLAGARQGLRVLRRHDDHRVARIDRGGDTFELRVDEAERSREHHPRRGAVVDVTTEPRHAGVTDEM